MGSLPFGDIFLTIFNIFLAPFDGALDGPLRFFLEYVYGNGMMANATDILAMSPKHDMALAWGIIVTIYRNTIVPVGHTLLALYFVIEILDKTSQDSFNTELFIKLFIKLLIGSYLITNGLEILSNFLEFGTALLYDVTAAANLGAGDGGVQQVILDKYLNQKIMHQIGSLLELVIPFVVAYGVGIVITMQCYGRLIEILARTMLAPIAMADIFSEGTKGGGFRYLRKYIAVVLQGAVIIAILVGSNAISTQISEGDTINIIALIAVKLTTVTLVGKSSGIANDLVGV